VAKAGRDGRDGFATIGLAELRAADVDLALVEPCDRPTGCAAVCVDEAAENLIAVAGGANQVAAAARIDDSRLGPGTTVLMQMEVPPAQNAALIARARARGARCVLNLAPAGTLAAAALAAVDVRVVNVGEAHWVAREAGVAGGDPEALTRALAARWGNVVVTTLGGAGAIAVAPGAAWSVPALPVKPVDTVGAGDAFVGVLAGALDRGLPLERALARAATASGIACETRGAQPSLPHAAVIDARLARLPPLARLG
jgi:ribokinase